MRKITDPGAKEWAKKHILADFHDGLPIQLGNNPSDERLSLYKAAFLEISAGMNGEELIKFELFGQLCGLLLPPFARASACF